MRTLRRLLLLALLTTPFTTPLAVRADAVPGHHGGQVQDAGPYHVELVARSNEIVIYVTGPGNRNVETGGATGTATILSGKAKQSVRLTPAGGNALRGGGSFDFTSDSKVVVSITFPGQSTVQARFTPFAAPEAPAKSGK